MAKRGRVSLREAQKCITGRVRMCDAMHKDRRLWGWWVCVEVVGYGKLGAIKCVRVLGVGSKGTTMKVYDAHDTPDRKHRLYRELVFDPRKTLEAVLPVA